MRAALFETFDLFCGWLFRRFVPRHLTVLDHFVFLSRRQTLLLKRPFEVYDWKWSWSGRRQVHGMSDKHDLSVQTRALQVQVFRPEVFLAGPKPRPTRSWSAKQTTKAILVRSEGKHLRAKSADLSRTWSDIEKVNGCSLNALWRDLVFSPHTAAPPVQAGLRRTRRLPKTKNRPEKSGKSYKP